MRRILLPGVVVLGAMTSDGLAEPVRLTDVQMDAVTSGQLDRLVARVATLTRDILTDPDFRRGVVVTNPRELALPTFGALVDVFRMIPEQALAAAPDETPSDNPVVIVRPEIVSNRTRSGQGNLFDRVSDILGSSFERIPTVVTSSSRAP